MKTIFKNMIAPLYKTKRRLWAVGLWLSIFCPDIGIAQSLYEDDVYNTILGFSAGNTLNNGGEGTLNTFLGYSAGFSNTRGNRNVFIGDQAGQSNRIGNCNIYIGLRAGGGSEGHDNLFLGYKAGEYAQVNRSTFVGYQTGLLSTGPGNVFVGYRSGENNRAGFENTYLGFEAGLQGIAPQGNVFLGYRSGREHVEGSRNVFLGYESGYQNASGAGNIFIGHQAGYYTQGSNQLWIDNQADSIPLIFGDFEKGGLGINTLSLEDQDGPYHLAVAGRVRADDLKLFPHWPEIQANAQDELLSLDDLSDYILNKGQLPRLPSSREVSKEGIFVGEMNALLLEKIQELTLYMIAQHHNYHEEKVRKDQKILDLERQIEALQKQMNQLGTPNKK